MRKLLSIFIFSLALQGCDSNDKPLKRYEIDKILSEYFVKNPDHLQKALDNLAKIQKENDNKKYQNVLDHYNLNQKNSEQLTFYGSQNAKKTLVIFSDYNCAICKRAAMFLRNHPAVKNGSVRVSVKELPIISTSSKDLAAYALVAAYAGKYESFHHTLMATSKIDANRARKLLSELSISDSFINEHMTSKITKSRLSEIAMIAKNLNISGTPTIIIGNEIIRGWNERSVEEFLK